tara:strand:- start:2107 stop:2241 length:135 start_codon:yes stop_codon:yes gene_type:complete
MKKNGFIKVILLSLALGGISACSEHADEGNKDSNKSEEHGHSHD